jgi:hypothetical protein
LIPEEKQILLKKKIKNGYPIGELKQKMLEEGFTLKEINDCIGVNKADMRSWYLFFGVTFFVGGIWLVVNGYTYKLMSASILLLALYYRENLKRNNKA